ncbi:sterol desaturase family protein [Synechococcus sp. MIT S9508]|uniref:sterol desaturase family protein n=1 Tax=Synechococcus sp. MIT S9508 TaxID=1801629 RepID=UPI0018D371D2|nr:sterol desaturase family protein [Synechococcus sp. MIT S9508]
MLVSLAAIFLFAIGMQFHLHYQFQPLLQGVNFAPFLSFSELVVAARELVFVRVISLVMPVIIISGLELHATFSQSVKHRNGRQKRLSIQKLFSSKGYKYQDLFYYFYGLLALPASLLAFISIGTIPISEAASENFTNLANTLIDYIPSVKVPNFLLLALAVAAGEFTGYWGHRINHKIEFFWKIHELHHSATEMCIFNVSRLSVLDGFSKIILLPFQVISALLMGAFVVNCGIFGLIIFSLHMSLLKLNEYAGHSSMDIRYPWPLTLVYLEPRDHWLHHSIDENHYGKNYGVGLSIWDKLFGTYMQIPSSEYSKLRYGVSGTDYNKAFPLVELFLKPPLLAIKSLKKSSLRMLNISA